MTQDAGQLNDPARPPAAMTEREAAVYRQFFAGTAAIKEVATALGLSKGQVAGLVHRMREKWPALNRLRPPKGAVRAAPRPKPRPAAKRRPGPAVRIHRPPPPAARVDGPGGANAVRRQAVDPERVRAFALGLVFRRAESAFAVCQWIDGPVERGVTPVKCGADTAPGAPYCPAHCARAYRIPDGRTA